MRSSARQKKLGLSLIEVVVAIAVFALAVIAIGGVIFSLQQSWQKQKTALDLLQNSHWAMEAMVNEIRHACWQGGFLIITSPWFCGFDVPPGAIANRVWYWRGNGGAFGNTNVIYRGTGPFIMSANNNRQELANFMVDNPGGAPLFSASGGLITIQLTVSKDGRSLSLRSNARARNY